MTIKVLKNHNRHLLEKLEELEVKLEDAQFNASMWMHTAWGEQASRAKVEKERDSLQVDAERYRWLRSREAECDVCIPGDFLGVEGWVMPGFCEELDAAIDAARAALAEYGRINPSLEAV